MGGLCSTGVVTRLEAHGAALLPPLLVGAPSDLRSAPPLVMLTGVPNSGIEGDPPGHWLEVLPQTFLFIQVWCWSLCHPQRCGDVCGNDFRGATESVSRLDGRWRNGARQHGLSQIIGEGFGSINHTVQVGRGLHGRLG